TSFGPTAPPFLDYLKNILRRYPDGGQILKQELIQNADDGQATEVVFIHDERRYGTESLWTNKLGKYQPALYAYNNAAFTEEDWERIQMAGRSGKVNDPNKIGRFGIGFNSVYHITKSEDYKETQWLVTTCTMKKGIMEDLDVLAEKLSFVPRVDLAFPSSEQREHGEGRLSCFLPLPNNDSNKTGLPVHVNACFGLTDNRRHLKWKEEDQKHDKHALWNELLVNKVLPKAFVVMIQDAIKLCQESRLPVSSVYRLWPDISHMQHKDKWLEVARDVFDQLFRQDAAVLSLAKDERWFIPLSDAIIPSNGSESPDIVNAVKRTLVFYGENLVTVPDHVMKAIVTTSHTTPKQVTPGFLRRVLLRNGMQYIDKEDKLCLLEFVLSDENYKELQGLQLLPLSDGSFRSFTNREEDTALIDTKEFPTLLPCCKHLFISNDLSSTCKTYLKKLASKKSKQAVLLTTTPRLATDLPMPDSYIQCTSKTDDRFLQLLKVNILGPAEAAVVLVELIERKSCSAAETEKIMTWILQHGSILFSQNEVLKYRCRDLRFIQRNGEQTRVSSFFDPRVKTFGDIFEANFFPPAVYTRTEQMLESLTELGLKSKETDVKPEHLLQAAKLVEKLHANSPSEAFRRSQVLLGIMDSNDLLSVFSAEQLHQLKMIRWLQCDQPGHEKRQLMDESEITQLYSPCEVRHTMYEHIVGLVMPLTGKLSERVSSKLGLKQMPPPEKVTENLLVVKSSAKEMTNPDTNADFKQKLHCIYGHMQKNVSAFAAVMDKKECWLWAHNQFASPQKLVLDYPGGLDLSSYIVKVPNEFLPYKKLLQEFGLRTSLSDKEVIAILYSIQKSIEERQQPFASPAEVKVSTEILCWIWRQKKEVPEDIPVLVVIEDEQFTLKPRSEALICDLGKDKLKECKFSIEEMYIVHEEIPIAAAEWLKIKFLSNHILAPESLGIEQYGQREPITTRIKNILKEYDEPNDIFKELIQNAEDAGADTCKFMIDFREHRDPPESLIDPGMSLCQGPCLWAFNNKQFTTEDWENIVKVGSASKETKVEKIGKFGLGFNTVYHVTDVPSILSGSRLLILDPNVTHLKKHIQHQTNPGIRLDLSQKRILDCFPGQFAQYEHIFDCNFSRQSPPEPYTGTLIKLPFRSEEEVLRSEISTKVFYKHDILALRDYFRQNSKSYLLFLKNINTLSLQSISCTLSTPPKDDEMETILTISKTVEELFTIEETSNLKQDQAVNSLQKIDAKCKDIIDSCTVSIIKMTRHEQFGEPEEDFWLLYNCFGTGASLEKVLQKNDTAVFSLPIGGVAVPLQKNPDTGKLAPLNVDFVGQAFCSLPLPIHTGLPVNVNGAFAVMSNRKSLWQSGEKRSWNEVLLRDPVTTAYITALLALKKMSEEKQLENYCYHSFWPNREKVSDSFKPLVDEFYSSIAQQATDLELFSDGERWCSMNNAMFLHESIEEDTDIGALAAQICKEHVNKPKCVVSLPVWLRNSFKQCGLHNILQSIIMTWTRFYQEVVFENLDVIDPKSRDAIVLHAIDLNNKDINTLLVHHPCIPTSNGQLQCVKKLVSPMGKVACLYEPKEGRLLGGTKNDFLSPKRIQRLLELGMTNDNFPLEEIALKAETITDTWKVNRKKAYEHLKCLLEIMKKHMDDQDSCSWETLRITAFLPAFSPGDIKMEGKAKLYKPTEVFTDECSMLVNMIHPVLDSNGLKIHNADPVLEMLGLQRNPDSKTVLYQLQKASNRKGSTDTPMLQKIACTCYKFLDQWISECDDIALFSQQANSFPFIFIGDTFVNVDQVAESDKFEAKPYLHVLPATFKSCRNLWESVGVAKTFTTSHFQTVLHNIHVKYKSKPLSKGDLAICLSILKQALHETDEINTDDYLIPNAKGVLQPASELFFNDSQWIPVSPSVTLCHEDIPRSMALHFGIQTIRHHNLEHFTDDNFSAFSFDFEQHEELAVRIKNIISAYSSKKDILKELIQNADDAEATEIHFVWDKRQHGKEKTFGERWNHLQGPALCVFNNKVFSDEDLKGIQQLGEGGKRETLGKTGKFGVGFNSVYHLTDCPSILTGDTFICISDPNMKYIETQPNNHKLGIGYKLADTFKEMYDDVYRSFLPEQFLLEEGTMFRLPLRTEYSAKNSRISCQEVTERDMRELCSALSDDPEGLILFLKNICKITVHEINNQSGKLQTIFAVEKSLAQENREEKDEFVKCPQDAFESQRPVTPSTVFYKTTVSTSNKRQSTWLIAEQFGSSKSRTTVFDKPPQGAIAALVSTKGADVSSLSSFKGRAFCSLPLPGVTGLPVHVNGNFEVNSGRKNLWKEDGQSQKLDWNEFLTQDVIAPLYAEMLHYIKQRIGVKTVSLASLETSLSASYLNFWPIFSTDVSTEWHEMIHEVYRSIKEKGLDLIPVLRSSTQKVASRHIKEYTFDWCNLRETEITKVPYLTHCSDDMNNDILEALEMKLVPSTIHMDKIWKSFKSAGIEVKNVSPAAFLQAKPLNDPTKTDEDLPLPLTDTLIRDKRRCSQLLSFCLKDPDSEKMKHNPNLLDGIPLLLTRDEVLRVFDSASPKLISAHENLFSDYKDNFADYETNKSHIKILEASNLVNSLTLPCAAKYLKPLIQQHLQKCDVDLDSGLHVPNEAMMQWLKSLWRFLSSEVKPQTSKKDGKAQTLEDVLKFFSDCCILPVVYTRLKNKRLLQRITNIRSVIKFTSETKITSILFKLGFLKLDYMFFNLCKYHQAFAAQRNVVEIRSSLIKVDPKYQDLIWTSMPIIDLPVKITPPLLQMMKNIGAHEKPPPHLVTANMRNICQSPCSNEQQIKTRAEVFRSAYAFLQAVDFPAETLTDLPVVLVEEDTQLAKASDVCLSLKDDLEFRPYLHKIPPHDALFGEFFRKIGVKDAPTAGHFCSVLAAVHADSTEKQQLNANQLKTVKRAVEQLFNLLKAQGHAILADVEILYLPAVDGKLYSSSSLFYNDTTFETKRLEEALENKFLLLGKLSKCHLDCDIHEQHRLVQLLPSSLQPKMLTELTREEVIETLLKPCKFLTVCEFSGWFNQHLSSKELRHGLVCLLKDQSQGKVSQKEASEMCDRAFGSIQIICCESLATMLCMDNEQLDKTTRETDVFVRRKQHGCIVYLKHNEDMAPKVLNAINMALTKEMNLLLDHRLTSEHLQVLGQLLLCDDLQDVQKCLADNNIHDSVDTESVLFNPPDPGTEIPEEWHDALDMSFFNNFEKGEYVGYRFNDKYIYAVIAEETPGDAGRCSQRYKVDVGQNEFVEVSHLDLYQFKREKTTHLLSMELEPLAGAPPRSSNKSSRPLPASLSEAKSDIDKCLTALWSLPSEERQKGIKRLYLRWHPDKNPDSLELATEAFQYLLNRIDELTKGEGGQSSSWGNWDFSNFHEQWNREARYHRSSQERSFSGCNSNNFWTHYTNIPRPNKEEAQRWFRQARCDLDAAQKDSDGESTEWCLFKIHQAVEKALTAAEFKRTGQRTANSTISATAEKVSRYHSLLRDLPEIVDDLKKLGVDNRKTQYPSCHAFPHIPN
uniref:Uncharacterized protein n=1 Tax=Oryzias latipes TaxID=8090 RepID=A0A3P9JYB3_ORYLA